ncbi:metallophosphoesterase family protein [Lacinutrix sp. 5H-3-7-4]|uniref:metallophosphoesterase family protein n=1 Tax=Lacinutrix sp. (strain 5H-3-7-4) TaxID=983544 RepID=UPI00020A3AF1|nr:metallophosphoesterase family protein [Lacinutrix sp. 5H-3-7-4]AEH00486.1 metallophosphoesterase [Lacinutrix sp. 5H-3-7-4]
MELHRTFAIGDIHGGLKALEQVLERIEIQENDHFIFLGDYVDGWSESAQVIQYLIYFSEKYNCVFIKGNHDVWCEKWLKSGATNDAWLMHGGKGTVESYNGFSEEEKQKHLEFFQDMKIYFIDHNNRLFLHAGFTSMHGVEKEVFEKSFYTDRTLWEMALVMDKGIKEDSALYPNRLKHYKEIYIGHTPTTRFNSTEPMQAINVWNVDTGAAFTGKVSAINLDTKAVIQSDEVQKMYANEKGRNPKSFNDSH